MSTFLTSDLHFGHKIAAGHRGFGSTQEHDEKIISNWNSVVSDNDIVYVLGDVMFADKNIGRRNVSRLNGRKYLILGNHDRAAPNMTNGHLHINDMGDSWEAVVQTASISHDGVYYLLSHYPYDGDHTETSRYDQFRLRDFGFPLFHGHTHSKERTSYSKLGTLQIHVGLDAWKLKPISVGMAVNNR